MSLTDAELTILGLLAERPRHGYELERVVAERGMRNWTSLGFSSIYYVLDRLARRGLVEPAGPRPRGRSRATLRVTSEGRRQLAAGSLDALTAVDPPHARVLVGMANSPGLDAGDVDAALARRAEALRARLAEVRAARAAQGPLPPAADAIFDYAETLLRADAEWTERTRTADHQPTLERIVPDIATADRYDVRKVHKELYSPPRKDFVVVEVPAQQYLAVDGRGDPNTAAEYSAAVEALYSVGYAIKFAGRAAGRDLAVGPLEGLWRAPDMSAFTRRDKSAWEWTMLIPQPGWVDTGTVAEAAERVRAKKGDTVGPALDRLRLQTLREDTCVQILHVGSYDDEGPVLDRLHRHYLPEHGWAPAGDHHEIYLTDARRTAPHRLRTILRQPVRAVGIR